MESGELVKRDSIFTLDQIMDLGWGSFAKYFWNFTLIVGLGGFCAGLPYAGYYLVNWLMEASLLSICIGLIFYLLALIGSVILSIGIINLQLKAANGEEMTVGSLIEPIGRFWSYLGATICFGFMIYGSALFFIFPAFYIYITFQFYPYFIVEKKMGPIKALEASAEITKGVKWELLFLSIILGFINGIGFCLFFIGGIPAKVFDSMVVAHTYGELRKKLETTPMDDVVGISDSELDSGSTSGSIGRDLS